MLTLVIITKKFLTLNLRKEPNLVLTFLLKILYSIMRPNFIVKFVKKNCTFITQ